MMGSGVWYFTIADDLHKKISLSTTGDVSEITTILYNDSGVVLEKQIEVLHLPEKYTIEVDGFSVSFHFRKRSLFCVWPSVKAGLNALFVLRSVLHSGGLSSPHPTLHAAGRGPLPSFPPPHPAGP